MKIYSALSATIIALVLFNGKADAQNLLNNPESVVFDSLNERYLVSNFADGNIVQIDDLGNQSYFDTTLTRIAGLMIHGDTLFVASSLDPYNGLVAYSLNTDEMLFYLPIAGAGLLNDLDYDAGGNIFLSDYWDNKLFRVDVVSMTYSLFVDSIYAPNGILCDNPNNRLLVLSVNAPGRPILAVDMSDGTISTVVNTNIPSLDGITRDGQNRIYISSWWSNSCYRYDTLYSNPPEIVSSGHNGPADIYVNRRDDILCVPNFYPHTVEFIDLAPSFIPGRPLPAKTGQPKNYPNPFNSSTTIEYNLPVYSDVRIDIFDSLGRKIQTIDAGCPGAGRHSLIWDAGGLSSGLYIYKILAGGYSESNKMLMIK